MGKNIIITESQLKYLINNNVNENKEILNEDETIRKVQELLKQKGYGDLLGKTGPNKDGVDGVLGKATRAAVAKYQGDNGIKQTGFPGRVTKGKLGITTTNQTNQSASQSTNQKTAGDSAISSNISGDYKSLFSLPNLKTTDSMYVCKANKPGCAQFVNDFTEKLDYVGDAWLAHDFDGIGKRVWSVYTNLNAKFIDAVTKIFIAIHKAGGWEDSGPMSEAIKTINQALTKNQPSANILKIDDIVGIYYPSSTHHEEAFYEAGKNYFIKDKSGNITKGKTLSGGKGFGMNTHLGIVGAIKDGVPLIFHNIDGQGVFSDPYNKLKGGAKIAWVKRK
jgi:peptidoglycan hydrolase-like protein with peptidoglycan-binding domain